MSRSFSATAEPSTWSEEKDKEVSPSVQDRRLSGATDSDVDDVEPVSSERFASAIAGEDREKLPDTASTRSKRPALSRVTSHLTTHSLPDPGPPPDGGLKAWTQVAAGWLAILTTWGWVNCFGVFQTYYTLHLDHTPSDISWIGTVQTFLTFFIGAFSGRLLDAGYFYPTLLAGVTLQLLGIFLMSISTKYWQLLLTQGLLTGLGGGIIFTPCMGIMATYFNKKRAWAMGIASTGNSAGGLVYPVVVRQLLPQLGFGWTTRILAFINLAFLATVVALMKPRLPPRKTGPLMDWPAFKEPPYTLFVVAIFFQVWCIYFTLYYVTSFGIQEIHLPFQSSAVLLIIVNGIGIPARLLPGLIGDRVGQLNTLVPISICMSIVAWSWLAVTNATGVYVFVCFYGIIVAAFQCLIPPTVASLTDDMRKIGTRFGMAFSSMGFGALTGPPIGGAIIGAQGGKYIAAQAWSAASCTICLVVLILTRMARSRGKLKAKV